MPEASGVHLVGSVSLSSAEEVFEECMKALPNRLRTIPDGESGVRDFFAYWQHIVFLPYVLGGPFHQKDSSYGSNKCS